MTTFEKFSAAAAVAFVLAGLLYLLDNRHRELLVIVGLLLLAVGFAQSQ